jgi:hypothetical protein
MTLMVYNTVAEFCKFSKMEEAVWNGTTEMTMMNITTTKWMPHIGLIMRKR